MPAYTLQIDVNIVADSYEEAISLFEKNCRSKLRTESKGIIGLVIWRS